MPRSPHPSNQRLPAYRTPSGRPRQLSDVKLTPDQRRFALTNEEDRFADEYLIDNDHRAASVRMGIDPHRGLLFLRKDTVLSAIALRRRKRLSRLQLYGDEIVRRWATLAGADPRELFELRRVNCRHCRGRDHEYRYDDVEYRAAIRSHNTALDAYDRLPLREREGRPPPVFDERGGPGFRVNDDPSPDCPKCGGDGIPRLIIKDTRRLSPAAVLLLDGFKVGPGGAIEVKLRDRSWAEQQLARHAGLFNDRAPVDEFDPDRMSDDQLSSVLHAMAERGVVEIEAVEADGDYETVTDVSEVDPADAPTEDNVDADR